MEYFFNKWIFRGVVFVLRIIASIQVLSMEPSKILKQQLYITCNPVNGDVCENTFYGVEKYCKYKVWGNESLCSIEYFPKGFTYGEAPSFIIKNFGMIVLIIVLLGFGLNHLLYNRKFRW